MPEKAGTSVWLENEHQAKYNGSKPVLPGLLKGFPSSEQRHQHDNRL